MSLTRVKFEIHSGFPMSHKGVKRDQESERVKGFAVKIWKRGEEFESC